MQVKLSASAGICKGVERAIRLALTATVKPVYLLGELAHNSYIIDKLSAAGCKVIAMSDIADIKSGSVVIRAHGIGRADYEILKNSGLNIIDATCPKVVNIHNLVQKYTEDGYTVIIVGNKNHPEVIGTVGWCNENCIVIENLCEQTFDLDKRYAVVCQTTFSEKLSDNIINYLKNTIKMLVINNTICYTTKERQRDAAMLSEACDTILVIGSKSSSNTSKLYDICTEKCKNVYLVENVEDAESIDKSKIQKLGVTAGASTPRELIMEVLAVMSIEKVEGTLPVAENEQVATESTAVAEIKVEKPAVKKAPMTMADVMAATEFTVKEGKKVKVSVIRADETGIFVTGLGKKDGFISADKATIGDYNPSDYKDGEEISAIIIPNSTSNKEYITLDKRAYDEIMEMDKSLMDSVFDLKIDRAVKGGGLLGKKGSFTVFVPASHIDIQRVEDEQLESYVGKTLSVKKLPDKKGEEGDNKRRRIVASHKEVILAEKRVAREKAELEWKEKKEKEDAEKKAIFEANIDRFEVNNVVPGIVKRFADFGAFVNVYGFDCLAPKGELSWTRDKAPSEVLELNKEYEFVIIKVDPENYKVSLSYKLLQKKPYEIAQEKYPVGTIVTGKVQTIVNFGAFVSIEPGIDGLVHVSNISDRRLNSPADVLKVGDEVKAKVISFTDTRMALSIKDVNVTDAEGEGDSEDKKYERPARTRSFASGSDRKSSKKNSNNELSVTREEQSIADSYNSSAVVTNNIFGDLLKDLNLNEESDNEDK